MNACRCRDMNDYRRYFAGGSPAFQVCSRPVVISSRPLTSARATRTSASLGRTGPSSPISMLKDKDIAVWLPR